MITIEQKIAQKENELARLKEKSQKLANSQKIVVGGMMLSIAKRDPKRAKTLLEDISNEVTKKTDLDRLQPIIDELTIIASKISNDSNHHDSF